MKKQQVDKRYITSSSVTSMYSYSTHASQFLTVDNRNMADEWSCDMEATLVASVEYSFHWKDIPGRYFI
jgi:hypothetical protein